jgi:hypothetical protein
VLAVRMLESLEAVLRSLPRVSHASCRFEKWGLLRIRAANGGVFFKQQWGNWETGKPRISFVPGDHFRQHQSQEQKLFEFERRLSPITNQIPVSRFPPFPPLLFGKSTNQRSFRPPGVAPRRASGNHRVIHPL